MFGKLTEEKIIKKLVKYIKKVLKVKNVPVLDLVTELGVSSIKIFEIYLRIEQSFKICFEENEITIDNLNNLSKLASLILSKK